MKNIIKTCAAVLMLVLLAAGLTSALTPAMAEAVATNVKPKSVRLDQSGTVKLPIGETLTLTPTLNPENASTTFKWKSSKKKVASVSGGVVTAKKVGTTTITVTTKNKKKAKVKVKVYDPYLPSGVYLDKTGTQVLPVSNILYLTAAMAPETAQSTLKWKTSNKKIATVLDGMVVGVAPGTATITVTTRNKKKAKVKVKVYDDGQQPILPPPGYDLPYVIYACKNSHTIAILGKDANGEWNRVIRLYPTAMGRKNVTDVGFYTLKKKERWHKWGSGYSPYASKISIGIYLHGPIFKKKNNTSIRPAYYNVIGTDGSSGCLRTVTSCAAFVYYNCPIGTMVIIGQNSRFSTPRPAKLSKKAKTDPTDPGANPEILVTSFAVEPGAMTLEKGASAHLTPTAVTPANTNTPGFTFATRDGNVAVVSPAGDVTAVGAGSTTIAVTAADDFQYTVEIPVTVTDSSASGKLVEAEEVEIPEEIIIEGTEPLTVEDAPVQTVETAEAPAGDEAVEEATVAEDAAAEVVPADAVETVETVQEYQEQDGLSFDAFEAEAVSEEQIELPIDIIEEE